jgi:RNA polymerase sigma-70 factor (ECF subfamily)
MADPERDVDLVAAAAAGDQLAFRKLYDLVFTDVERFIAGRVGAAHVEDLVAETFLRVYRSAGSYQDRGRPVVAWIITIARNVVASHHRAHAAAKRSPSGLADQRTVASIEELTVERSDREQVLAALANLPQRQREVLTLRFLDGYSAQRCAAELDLTDEGVRALTYRALKALRRELQPDAVAE